MGMIGAMPRLGLIALVALAVACSSEGRARDIDAESPLAPSAPARSETDSPELPEFVGVVVPRASVDVSSSVGGKLETLPAPVGAKVVEGDVIATLANADLQHQLRLARASTSTAVSDVNRSERETQQAKERRKRAEQLGDFASGEERSDAKFEVERSAATAQTVKGELAEARASVARLEAQVEALTVRAEFSGTVAVHYESPGQILAPEAKIVRLISDEILLRFAVPHTEAHAFELGTVVEFRPDGNDEAIKGRVRGIAPEVDAASMVIIEASLEAGHKVPSGVSGHVRVASPA